MWAWDILQQRNKLKQSSRTQANTQAKTKQTNKHTNRQAGEHKKNGLARWIACVLAWRRARWTQDKETSMQASEQANRQTDVLARWISCALAWRRMRWTRNQQTKPEQANKQAKTRTWRGPPTGNTPCIHAYVRTYINPWVHEDKLSWFRTQRFDSWCLFCVFNALSEKHCVFIEQRFKNTVRFQNTDLRFCSFDCRAIKNCIMQTNAQTN